MASYDLVTLDEVRKYMGMASSKSPDNNIISKIITRNSQLFATYCRVDQFQVKTYTEYHDGMGSNYLTVDSNVPIQSVISLKEDDDWVFGSDSTVTTLYRIVDGVSIVLKDSTFADYTGNVKIVYSGGYTLIPEDIKLACIKETVRDYKHRKDFDVISKAIDDGGGSVQYVEQGLLTSTKDILNKYRKAVIV